MLKNWCLLEVDIKTKLDVTKNLVAIRQRKVTLTLNKTAYVGMYILDLSKVC